ncbi:MAG TPA: hypothetical protein DEG43_09505 [Acidimicrobiaceae bacterium]|jgi:uncharacterized membrane protein|nr:hypothetical protein [Acidimicrobiaceae bacterium]
MEISNSLFIQADAETVWALTVDVEALPALTPTISKASRLDHGPLAVGSRVRLKQPAQLGAIWTVTQLDPPTLFQWERTAGWLKMTATHQLESEGTGCRNTLILAVSGPGSGAFLRLFGSVIGRALETENQSFKERAEI